MSSSDNSPAFQNRLPQPGELWSLWDMLVTVGSDFYAGACIVSSFSMAIASLNKIVMRSPISLKPADSILAHLLKQCDTYQTEALKGPINRLRTCIAECSGSEFEVMFRADSVSDAQNLNRLQRRFEECMLAINDHLGALSVVVLSTKESKEFQEAATSIPLAIQTKFSMIVEDIECANKCICLGQPTASVFHLMRAMESVVQQLTISLGISNPEREWGKLLSSIDQEIKKMPKGDAKDSWSEARSNLFHVKQAVRNQTMHPKRTYTEAQAQEVKASTLAFMAHLSTLV